MRGPWNHGTLSRSWVWFESYPRQEDVSEGGEGINETFFRLRLIVLVALTTGMRIAEIFGLKWSDLLYREGLIAVRAKLKGGKIRYVPMPPELAGIEDFRFHDLRHTFASWYMMNGGDLYELANILGHSNIKMTERYAKLGDNISTDRQHGA